MKKFVFVAGLPRSGSTLLLNVLAQNPRFHVTPTSGLSEVLRGVKDGWNKVMPFLAMQQDQSETMKAGVLRGVLSGAYEHIDKPVIFEKDRSWPRYVEMLDRILDQDIKILATVRNPLDILASFEMRWRETSALGSVNVPQNTNMETIKARLEYFASLSGPFGGPFTILLEAIRRGHKDKIHFVKFRNLTEHPEITFKKIYEFVSEKPFEHKFKGIEQVTVEDDRIHGYLGLHKIRPNVEPVESKWLQVLGTFAEPYKNQDFWNK